MGASHKTKTSLRQTSSYNLTLDLLGDGDVAGADHADEGVVAAVAVDEVVVLGALLSVAVEEHVVGQQLGGEDADLLLRVEVGGVLELNAVHIGVRGELNEGGSQGSGFLLDDLAHVTFLGLGVEERGVEVEGEAHLGPATEEARALDLAIRLVSVGLALATQVQGGDAAASVGGLDHRAQKLAGIQTERSALLLVGLVLHGAGVDVHAVSAAVKAHEGAQPLARELGAAALAVIADQGQKHGVSHVHVTHLALLLAGTEAVPVVLEVLSKVVEIALGAVSGKGNILSHLQSQGVVRGAAATVPVITDFVDAKELVLSVAANAGIDGVSVLLLYARRAHAALLGQELHMLSDGQLIGSLKNTPVVGSESSAFKSGRFSGSICF